MFVIDRDYVDLAKTELSRKKSLEVPDIGLFIMPTLDEIELLNYYTYLVHKYCKYYNDPNMFSDIHDECDDSVIEEITFMIKMFTEHEQVIYNNGVYYCDTKLKIDESNFNSFVGVIKIAHHLIEEEEYHLPKGNVARQYMLEAMKRKKDLKRRQDEESERAIKNGAKEAPRGLQMSKLISSLCAKHPSINPLNIGQLTYYQMLDQFYMLANIEEFEIGMQSAFAGAAGDSKITHYTEES